MPAENRFSVGTPPRPMGTRVATNSTEWSTPRSTAKRLPAISPLQRAPNTDTFHQPQPQHEEVTASCMMTNLAQMVTYRYVGRRGVDGGKGAAKDDR